MTRFLLPATLFTLALFSLPAAAQPGPHDYGPGPWPHRRPPPPAVVIVEPAPVVVPAQPAPVVVLPAAPAAQTAAVPQPYCREYQTTTMVGGELKPSYGTACQQPDGSWKIVATKP
jgi:hypothetical protein